MSSVASAGIRLCPVVNHGILKSTSRIPVVQKILSPVMSKALKSFEEIPSPKSLPFFGTTLDLMRSGGAAQLHKYCDERHKSLGPIYREKMGSWDCVFIADAGLMQQIYQNEGEYPKHAVPEPWTIFNDIRGIERGLFFMNGPEWSQKRKSLNRLFLKKQVVDEYSHVFNQIVSDVLNRWAQVATDEGRPVPNLERELYNWSIESLGAMIFGRRLGCISSESVGQIHAFVSCIQQLFEESAKMTVIPAKMAHKLNLPVWKRFVSAADRALSLARGYVEENVDEILRPSASSSSCPFRHTDRKGASGILENMTGQENMEREEVVNIITDLFLAAADTTSHATQWALYLLAKSPESQERVMREVDQVLSGDSLVQEKHLPGLSYVKGVIKEALRLYPVAPFLSRTLDKDITLSDYAVPAGKMIVMSLYTTGRDPRYFPMPGRFMPERWLRNEDSRLSSVYHSHACLPFGMGVRSCIGKRVAEVQMQLLISRVVQKFKLSIESQKEVEIKLRMITTPEEPIPLILEPRC